MRFLVLFLKAVVLQERNCTFPMPSIFYDSNCHIHDQTLSPCFFRLAERSGVDAVKLKVDMPLLHGFGTKWTAGTSSMIRSLIPCRHKGLALALWTADTPLRSLPPRRRQARLCVVLPMLPRS